MRGKKAAQSQNRRDLRELTQRMETAERAAEKANRDLAAMRETHEATVADLIRQRDAVTMPALARAEAKIAELKAGGDAATAQRESAMRAFRRLRYILADILIERGFTPAEADSAIAFETIEIGPLDVLDVGIPGHALKAGRAWLDARNAMVRRQGKLRAVTERADELSEELNGRYLNALAMRGEKDEREVGRA